MTSQHPSLHPYHPLNAPNSWAHWQPQVQATLCLIEQAQQLLLIQKKRGLGAGYYTGVGGKLEAGESAEQASLRETREEIGITLHDQQAIGQLDFQFTQGLALRCFVFYAREFSGRLIETDEAKPCWFPLDQIPYDAMWQDDRYWIPLALAGTRFKAQMLFDDKTLCSLRLSKA